MAYRLNQPDDIVLSPAPLELPPSSQRRQLRALSGSQPNAQTQPSSLLSNRLRGESTQLDADASSQSVMGWSRLSVIREPVQPLTGCGSKRSVSRPSLSTPAAMYNLFGPGVEFEGRDADGSRRLHPIRFPGDPDGYVWKSLVSLGANDQEGWKGWQPEYRVPLSRRPRQHHIVLFFLFAELAALRIKLERQAEDPYAFIFRRDQPDDDDDDEATSDPLRALMDRIRVQFGRSRSRDDQSTQDLLDALRREADEEEAQGQEQQVQQEMQYEVQREPYEHREEETKDLRDVQDAQDKQSMQDGQGMRDVQCAPSYRAWRATIRCSPGRVQPGTSCKGTCSPWRRRTPWFKRLLSQEVLH